MHQYNTIAEALCAFVEDLETSTREWEIDFDKYSTNCREGLQRLYLQQDDAPYIRLSGIGKPIVLQMLPVLGYDDRPRLDSAIRDIFYQGIEWEERTLAKLEVWNPQVIKIERQAEVSFMGITGHVDCIVHVNGVGSCILELKTMNGYNAQNLERYGMDDDKGYLTQLALYCAALQMPGYWMVYDKQKATIKLFELDVDAPAVSVAVKRAERIIPIMQSIENLTDLLTKCKVPDPVSWTVKAGTFQTVPSSMKYCPHLGDLYQIRPYKGSTKPEVVKVFSPAEAVNNIKRKYVYGSA